MDIINIFDENIGRKINDIEKYKGKGLYVTKENRVALKKDEYFIADLIGCAVYLDTNPDEKFGEISDVMETGANDVYVIREDDTGRELLLPKIDECVLSISLEEKLIRIHILKGLLD